MRHDAPSKGPIIPERRPRANGPGPRPVLGFPPFDAAPRRAPVTETAGGSPRDRAAPTVKVTAKVTAIDANGATVGTKPATVVKEQIKTFVAHDRDPKTDEDGASVRIWRTK